MFIPATEIGPKLEFKIPISSISFKHFLHEDYLSLEEKPITDNELNEAIKIFKPKKSFGYDDIYSDVIQHISQSVFELLKYVCNLSLETGIFLAQLKMTKVAPLFKKGANASVDNHGPISVFPYFY